MITAQQEEILRILDLNIPYVFINEILTLEVEQKRMITTMCENLKPVYSSHGEFLHVID